MENPDKDQNYFHVFIKLRDQEKWQIWIKNLTKKDLMSAFVKQYKKGKPIFIDGSSINTLDIEKVIVSVTQNEFKFEFKKINDDIFDYDMTRNRKHSQDGSGFVFPTAPRQYKKVEMRNHFDNVTSDFINGAPGYGLSSLSRLIDRPIIANNIPQILLGLLIIGGIIWGYAKNWFNEIWEWLASIC